MGGILAVAGASAAVTVGERDAAIHTLDAKAATFRDLGQAALKRSGQLGPVATGARAQGVKLSVSSPDRPLPGD